MRAAARTGGRGNARSGGLLRGTAVSGREGFSAVTAASSGGSLVRRGPRSSKSPRSRDPAYAAAQGAERQHGRLLTILKRRVSVAQPLERRSAPTSATLRCRSRSTTSGSSREPGGRQRAMRATVAGFRSSRSASRAIQVAVRSSSSSSASASAIAAARSAWFRFPICRSAQLTDFLTSLR